MDSNNRTRISVRNLVEFILRSGDLVSAFAGGVRALEGTKAHQRYQRMQPREYVPEVTLSCIVETPAGSLAVSGRADGVMIEEGRVVIDEIKTTTRPLEDISGEDDPLYWAQAKCYAHMYAAEHALASVEVQVTYCHLDTKKSRSFCRSYSSGELAAFFRDLAERYLAWAARIHDHVASRNGSIERLGFPFPGYRPGQRELAVAVYQTMTAGKKLFAQAPTGIGKTMATLFPAIKALGGGHLEKIFYLTAKTSTRELAEKALACLRPEGLAIKSLTLTAKEKICFLPGAKCDAEECDYARGHFDRVNGALQDILTADEFTRPVVEEYARKHRVCPFEFSLDLAYWADCVICDYNYAFDPRVALRRFFAEGGDYGFLVDEAHNLPDRAREMFSATLTKAPLLELRRAVRQERPRLAKALGALNTCLAGLRKRCEENPDGLVVQNELPEDILPHLWKFVKEADAWLALNQPAAFGERLLELYFAVAAFLRIADCYDECYRTYMEKTGRDVLLKLFCIDPSRLLRARLGQGKAAVFFSATLTPLDYYNEMLGGNEGDGRLQVGSPFPRKLLRVLVADDISTRYKRREATYDQVVERIEAAIGAKAGNYLVFFPSYRYLEEVCARFAGRRPDLRLLCQTAAMAEPEREAFLAQFSAENREPLVGFAVLGGIFGEGIDLVGERLTGAIIVGVGLPQLCAERDIIRDYFAGRKGAGFEYAYAYPGMNKVLQAAGRVIRTERDKGVVLLIDERYAGGVYRQLLPAWWRPLLSVRSPRDIGRALKNFWDS
ncbi:MAG TPA: ATP-dependent DNA helicase [Selenomonadales bacterium]|nr:ATP-dependent DNA helicase [Selenomonadales bacterium]